MMDSDNTYSTLSNESSGTIKLPCIIIPAFKPDRKLIDLVNELHQRHFCRIIIIDDGSGEVYTPIFEQAARRDCVILRHAINMGKGRALKTGLNEAINCGYADLGVITADADGQHNSSDILKIADAMKRRPESLVLGTRHFTGQVPWKNRIGNTITRIVFSLINGDQIYDTQTGLRGLPAIHLPLILGLSGERYEYEMNMLLAVRPNNITVNEVAIDTIYIEENKSSHFKVVLDSIIIYGLLFKYTLSSLFSFAVDYIIFALINITLPNQLIVSVIVARSISSLINFLVNRNLVFRQKGATTSTIFGYYILVVIIMIADYGLIKLLFGYLNMNVYLAKIIADTVLYFVGFRIQRDLIFRCK